MRTTAGGALIAAFIAAVFLLALYLGTRSSTLFAACCVPVGFAVALLAVAGLFGFLKKQAFRGDLL